MKRRPFLIGMLSGVALAIASVGGATLLSKKQAPQYLRVIDDNPHSIQGPNNEQEFGPLSARLIRNCKIERFVTDSPQPDYTGSSFVKIDGMPKAYLNCLIGEARTNSLSIAIVDGIDTTPAECIGGWPTRFQKESPGGFELCRGQKNPNPIFIPTSPPKR
ncbi:hypothetical protein [Sphingopyxis sp.]|uniref:hypothetical protein n=1 Tax=Sphingopyxis sp. TaxID=1908224 RepID=UPI002D79A562|nr:hypothetical protein [Sphingopyxis sp.]HET6525211.1 hypothetical protein [Sphingopyxis sp.]